MTWFIRRGHHYLLMCVRFVGQIEDFRKLRVSAEGVYLIGGVNDLDGGAVAFDSPLLEILTGLVAMIVLNRTACSGCGVEHFHIGGKGRRKVDDVVVCFWVVLIGGQKLSDFVNWSRILVRPVRSYGVCMYHGRASFVGCGLFFQVSPAIMYN